MFGGAAAAAELLTEGFFVSASFFAAETATVGGGFSSDFSISGSGVAGEIVAIFEKAAATSFTVFFARCSSDCSAALPARSTPDFDVGTAALPPSFFRRSDSFFSISRSFISSFRVEVGLAWLVEATPSGAPIAHIVVPLFVPYDFRMAFGADGVAVDVDDCASSVRGKNSIPSIFLTDSGVFGATKEAPDVEGTIFRPRSGVFGTFGDGAIDLLNDVGFESFESSGGRCSDGCFTSGGFVGLVAVAGDGPAADFDESEDDDVIFEVAETLVGVKTCGSGASVPGPLVAVEVVVEDDFVPEAGATGDFDVTDGAGSGS